jgi:hypothetical protein
MAPFSSPLPGIDVAGARDDFLDCHCLALLRLVANTFHVGVDVDGLACRLCCPANCG